MYQRNVRPKALRWQMHSGGQPQRRPAGLWRRSTNPTTVSLRRPSRAEVGPTDIAASEGRGRLAASIEPAPRDSIFDAPFEDDINRLG